MSYAHERVLKIFYFYNRSETYALYNLDNYYFVIFLNGGHGGGDRVVQITKQSFDELMIDDHNFSQIIEQNIKLKYFNKTQILHKYVFLSISEPYKLYKLDNQYFIELWAEQSEGQSQAVEIDEKDFDQLLNETILPSQIL